ADGTEILDGENYPGFPIVPLWGNLTHQSEIVGLREKIDGYDLIQSGFANDLDDCSQIYWTIQNAGGMDDVDLAKFLDRLKVVKAAVVEDDGARAESHTVDIPYQARMTALADIRDSLYRDAMALDTDKISAGNVTATAINAAYENLDLKCDRFEMCVSDFIDNLLKLIGVEDSPNFKRTKVTNLAEETQMVIAASQFLDDETILKHLPFLSPDEIEDVLERKKQEEIERFNQALALQNGAELETPEMGENEVVESTETEKEIING
ncbi:MAG: phage portal protein, partial [Lachnospiraceae bacterium]|nr:phage portal protein [Lachnospiraceae bacterium]